MTAQEAWKRSQFREGRNVSGSLLFRRADELVALVGELLVVDLTTGETVALRELLRD